MGSRSSSSYNPKFNKGTVILKVSATDLDEKRNDGRGYGDIGYKLLTESECCSIGLKDGVIRVKEGKNRISRLLTC